MSEQEKLEVGQKRKWEGKDAVFEIIYVGNQSVFYRYNRSGSEGWALITEILTNSTDIKPEPKRTKLCAYELTSVGEIRIFREIPPGHLLENWTKKNLVVIDGELFVEEN